MSYVNNCMSCADVTAAWLPMSMVTRGTKTYAVCIQCMFTPRAACVSCGADISNAPLEASAVFCSACAARAVRGAGNARK